MAPGAAFASLSSARSASKVLGDFLRAGVLLLALVGAGCTTINVPEKDNEPVRAPATAPKAVGIETPDNAEHRHFVADNGGEYHWRAAQNYLNTVLARLAANSDPPMQVYRVTILDTPVVNAYALPSGNIYVTRGLLALANDTSEVAAVMAHEIGHVISRHAAQLEELEKRSAVINQVASLIQKPDTGKAVETRGLRSLASFSRQQELEADAISVRTLARAGYDPYAASRFLVSLGHSAELSSSLIGRTDQNERLDILANHPSTPERVAAAIAEARQISAPGVGETARNEYLGAIDGMMFGDDPAQGSIHGRVFVHSRLGFGFVAPDGFAMVNSPQAVQGITKGGNEALRLDNVYIAQDKSLETYLESGWIAGLQHSSITSGSINGLNYATGIAKTGDWSFRVAAIRLGNKVYRMIFGTMDLSSVADSNYRASIESFHRLSSEEVQKGKIFHLALITALEGDSSDQLAERMKIGDHALDYLLLINGLERGESLKPNEKYKIIVE